jgi:hypothetical protein
MAPKPISIATPRGTVKTYPSLRQLCAALGISYAMAHKRLHKYKSPSPTDVYEILTAVGRQKPIKVRLSDNTFRLFPSKRAAAKYLNVPYLKAWKALKRGWTPEQAFGVDPPPKRKSSAAKPVVVHFKGKTYHWASLMEAAKANGQTYAAVRDRLRRGWSLTQSLGMEDSGRRPHKIAVSVLDRGRVRHFESKSKLARAYGISTDLVITRLNKLKWSPEEAVEIVPRSGQKRPRFGIIYVVTHRATGRQYVGQTKEVSAYHRWQKHIEELSKPSTKRLRPLIQAIQEFGPDAFSCQQIDGAHSLAELNEKERYWIQKLGTLKPNGFNATRGGQGVESGKSVTVRGEKFRTQTEAARHFGVPVSTVSRWLKRGTPEQALGLSPRPKRHADSRRQPVVFTHNGRAYTYKSKRAAAKAHRIPEKKLYRRLNSGWRIQEALGLVRRPGADQKKPLRLRQNGETKTYPSEAAAAKKHCLAVSTLQQRLARGWSVRRALLTPPGRQGRHRQIGYYSGH